ncbi:hypothetical protein ACP70R_015879 [Stipagrostis hirtigluma subsp. patula]
MKTPTAKALVAGILSSLLVLFLFFLCASSSSPQAPSSALMRMSRRLLLSQCHGASTCSTQLSRFNWVYKAPKVVSESLKRMPKSRSNPSHN